MPTLADVLKGIDYGSLPLSDYSRDYVLRMLPSIDYYEGIYRRCLDLVAARVGKSLRDMTLVDYGGGHGFLGMVARQCGVGRVVYVDINPLAAEAVRTLSGVTGLRPDAVLVGDAATLRAWCVEHGVVPDAVMGMDVIEHVYRLDTFFADLHAVNPAMTMLFTTGSTPYNPWVRHRLHVVMDEDERVFRRARFERLRERFPDMDEREVGRWATMTRGLTFDDAVSAVREGRPFAVGDRHNTCDPATGSWTERILPLSAYRQLLGPYGFRVDLHKGCYNGFRGGAKGRLSRCLNSVLRLPGTRWVAPFIILLVTPEKR